MGLPILPTNFLRHPIENHSTDKTIPPPPHRHFLFSHFKFPSLRRIDTQCPILRREAF